MKKSILISVLLLLVIVATYIFVEAKPPKLLETVGDPEMPIELPKNQYPDKSGTIKREGYSYDYRNEKFGSIDIPSRIELYNAACSFVDVELAYKDGTPFTYEEEMGYVTTERFSDSSQTKGETMATVRAQFTSEQKELLKGKSMFMTVRFDTTTDRIADVYFSFFRKAPFVYIPIETYRAVEVALKEKFWLTLTNDGRKLNYIQLYWSQEF